MIRRNFRTIGNSFGIIIPKSYLQEMGINPVKDDVFIEVKDSVLMVKKAPKEEK